MYEWLAARFVRLITKKRDYVFIVYTATILRYLTFTYMLSSTLIPEFNFPLCSCVLFSTNLTNF
jgi:glycopeptide antibiotics resistance protein